jgi:hypothetical protein
MDSHSSPLQLILGLIGIGSYVCLLVFLLWRVLGA